VHGRDGGDDVDAQLVITELSHHVRRIDFITVPARVRKAIVEIIEYGVGAASVGRAPSPMEISSAQRSSVDHTLSSRALIGRRVAHSASPSSSDS
jgi:hypothetical protein